MNAATPVVGVAAGESRGRPPPAIQNCIFAGLNLGRSGPAKAQTLSAGGTASPLFSQAPTSKRKCIDARFHAHAGGEDVKPSQSEEA